MAVLIWGPTVLLLAWLIHLIVWRARVLRYQTRALACIYAGTLAVVLTSLAALSDGRLPPPLLLRGGCEYAQVALMVTALAMGYIISYSAVEAESPTLMMIRAIAAAGPRGLAEADFRRQLSDEQLVIPRVADLVRDGMVRLETDRYVITAKGRRFVGIFILFRNICGAGKGG